MGNKREHKSLSDEEKAEVMKALAEEMKKMHEEKMNSPWQYIVGIYKKDTNALIGYHLSTLGQVTKHNLDAKRYVGENPYGQLEVIWNNISKIMDYTPEKYKEEKESGKLFCDLFMLLKNEHYENLTSKDLYIEAVYLGDKPPKQEFRMYSVADPKK